MTKIDFTFAEAYIQPSQKLVDGISHFLVPEKFAEIIINKTTQKQGINRVLIRPD